MIEVSVTNNTEKILEEIEAKAWEGLRRCVVLYHTKLLELLSVPNTGERRKHRTRKTPSGRAASYTVYPHPSKPGEPPRKRTGWLQRHVLYELDRASLSGRIGLGTSAQYGLHLHLGTQSVDARPWITVPLDLYAAELIDAFRQG